MQISSNGIALIKGQEGFAPKPTNDMGHVMWGHGHDRVGDEPIPVTITMEEADELLLSDLNERFVPAVNQMAPWANQNQFDALCDFAYNEGTHGLAQLVAHGQTHVAEQLPRWKFAGGKVLPALARRRAAELALYNA